MDVPQIEKLISEAIANRPVATAAPLNLYVYNGRVICGARAVMPKNARFISHITPQIVEHGFSESDWKAVVEKALWISKDSSSSPVESGDFKERRREQRLKLGGSVWFNSDGDGRTLRGQLVDVSSSGMAFTCYNNRTIPARGQQITARFSVPFFTPDGVIQERKFTRTAKICRISGPGSYLKRIAVQFAEPLPFRPAEQDHLPDADVTVISSTQS
ncbi:MAG: PilZ domain-containing protein [Phycisphaerae bacterium]|nr:PilZ domain-containing protein [Phycisphaerae bacterium]